jgi:small subunit ribosomal protein S20
VPRLRSAKKALRQSRRRAAHNRTQRSALRTALKRVRNAPSPEDAAQAYRAAVQLLDRAARQGLIHANNAARHKSRLARYVKAKS